MVTATYLLPVLTLWNNHSRGYCLWGLEMKKLIIGTVLISAVFPLNANAAGPDCKTMLELHGMLSRAQFQCKFSSYSNDLMDLAKVCFNTVGRDASKQFIRDGMDIFDFNEKKRGHKKMCASVLQKFPNYVRK